MYVCTWLAARVLTNHCQEPARAPQHPALSSNQVIAHNGMPDDGHCLVGSCRFVLAGTVLQTPGAPP